MGKGDKKTKRGKIIIGSYGNKRRKKRTPLYVPPVKRKPAKKAEPVVEEVVVEVEEVIEVPKKETILPTRTPPSPYAPIRGVTRARYRRKPIGAVRPLNKASKAKRLAEKKKKRQDILNKAVKR